jgi:hypothetical protein
MTLLTVVLFFCLFIAAIPTFFFSCSAKEEIALVDPEYCQRLYRSAAGRLFSNQWPIRAHVLFTEEPPAKVAGTIRILRILYGAFLACAAGLVITFLVSAV